MSKSSHHFQAKSEIGYALAFFYFWGVKLWIIFLVCTIGMLILF